MQRLDWILGFQLQVSAIRVELFHFLPADAAICASKAQASSDRRNDFVFLAIFISHPFDQRCQATYFGCIRLDDL